MQNQEIIIPEIVIRDNIKEMAMSDIHVFSSLLGYVDSPHQSEWLDIASNKSYSKILIEAPRGHAKSTKFSVQYPLWEIVNDNDITILLVSNTNSQVKAFLRQITSIIERNKRFNTIFGNLKPAQPEKWTDTEILLERSSDINKPPEEKDPTISVVGAGGAILSKRAKIIICDDLLNKENTRTAEQRKKLLDWFNDVLLPVLDPIDGRLIVIGTPFDDDDLLATLMKDPTFDIKRKYQAILKEADRQDLWNEYKQILLENPESEESKKNADLFYKSHKLEMDMGARVLWEARMPYKKLSDIRISSGTRSFSLMYQCDSKSISKKIFKAEWIDKCADRNRRLLNSYDPSRFDLHLVGISQGVDLATSEQLDSASSVDLTLGKTNNGKYIILNCIFDDALTRWSPMKLRENISEQANLFHSNIVIVESNAFQNSISKEMKLTTTIPIKAFTTTGEKFDEDVGVNSMAVLFENGQFIIPCDPSDLRTIEFFELLKGQLLDYPSGHTGDLVMALWFAIVGLRNISSNKTVRVKAKRGMFDVKVPS